MVALNAHLIFGLHGPVLDTEYEVSAITADIAANRGAALAVDDVHLKYSGLGSKDKFRAIGAECGVTFTEAQLDEMREEHRVRKDNIGRGGKARPAAGIEAALRDYAAGNTLTCMSTDPLERSQFNLKATNLLHRFDGGVFGPRADMRPLPGLAPSAARFADVLLQAMEQNNIVAPENTVVIDDAETGMRAGRAVGAGLVIGILDPRFTGERGAAKAKSLTDAGADFVIRDYKDLGPLLALGRVPEPAPATSKSPASSPSN